MHHANACIDGIARRGENLWFSVDQNRARLVAEAGIVEDGIKVSENMQVYGIRSIEAMKELLATSGLDGFHTGSETLVQSCNSCHAASGHSEIVIGVPTQNRFTGQIFTPKH